MLTKTHKKQGKIKKMNHKTKNNLRIKYLIKIKLIHRQMKHFNY